ncbi:MAG: hypothetical protein E7523_11500 [Ruminococcaceae bacterium]|nr:hypothetical protein [Oscillospiraceae bacterium]
MIICVTFCFQEDSGMTEIKLPNGDVVKAYPITGSQKMMYLMSLKYGSGYPVNNIGCGVYWKGEINKGEMKAAIYEAVHRCDTMRLRFVMGKKLQLHQYVTAYSDLSIQEWDLSAYTIEEAKEQLLAFSRQSIPMFNCEVHKIFLVRFKDGYQGLFMRLHHLAMDAYSLKVFINDIMEIYKHRTQGTPYPKPMRDYIPALEQELAYETSTQHEADKQYWYDSLAKTSEPIFTDFMLDNRLKQQQTKYPGRRFADIHAGLPDADAVRFSMSKERSDKILKLCEEKDLSVFAVISMAVRTALSCFNDNQEDVSFKMIINRRGTIAEKKSGGLRINFLPMRSIISPDETFCSATRKISEIQNEMYLHARLSFLETLKERHKSMSEDAKFDSTYDSFGLSYQPLVPTVCIDDEMKNTLKSIWYNNGATMIPLYLTVSHRSEDAGLDFNFEYRREQQAAYDLTIFYNKMEKIFDLAVNNPDITVGEILKETEITLDERNGKPACNHSKNLSESLKITWKLTKSRLKTILSLISA